MTAKSAGGAISSTVRANIGALVDAYRAATGLSDSQIGKKFYGNSFFFRDFDRGKLTISLKKLDEMMAEFHKEWPEGADWPHLRPVFMEAPPAKKRRG